MKFGIIGGGSTYTPELVFELCRHPRLRATKVVLMDTDGERLAIVGGFTKRILAEAHPAVEIELTTERAEAIAGASYVICSIRPGGNEQRLFDEQIPFDMGLFPSETHGPGGFAFALRVLPQMVDIARDVARLAPDAWLVNVTNPTGMVSQAILQNSTAKAVGVCHAGITILPHIAAVLGVPVERISVRYTGLNHLGWILGVFLDGRELPRDQIAAAFAKEADRLQREVEFIGDPDLYRLWRWPLWSLDYRATTYTWQQQVREYRQKGKIRAHEVLEIEKTMLEVMARSSSLEELIRSNPGRGGSRVEQSRMFGPSGYTPGVLTTIDSLENDGNTLMALNVRNNGAISDLPDDVSVETSVLVRRDTIWPLAVGHLPPEIGGTIQIHKAYETLTIEAALTGSYEAALKALTIHPMVGNYDIARELLDKYLVAHRDFLPAWAGRVHG
jgi:6-phospho-beta-glucosidase